MTTEKRLITADDLYKMELISSLALSPDGSEIFYAQQRINPENQKKFSNLWAVSTRNGQPRQFTFGDQVDHSPQWSPDGSQVAFLSNRKDGQTFQIYLIPFQGGEARPLTDLKGQFGAFEWSPDGTKLACQFRKTDEDVLAREADEAKKKLGVVERHYTRTAYKFDGAGFLPKERWHLWLIDAQTGEATQLTDGEIYDETGPTWSPDGQEIVFTSNRAADPDQEFDKFDLYRIPAAGGEFQKIEAPDGPKQMPRFSPDGTWIAYYGNDHLQEWWRNTELFIIPVGGGAAQNLTRPYDLNIDPAVINDVNNGAVGLTPPTWSPDGQTLYFPANRHGSSTIQSISVDGQTLKTITPEPGTAGLFAFNPDHSQLTYFFATLTDPGQIFVQEMQTGQRRQLTNFNAWLAEVNLGQTEEIWFKGRDNNDLQGWILKPPGFDPAQKYPSIFEIHGGPMAQYGHYFMHEFFYLAAQGYVVYYTNPRGGQGYGEAHTKYIYGNWGDADYADLMIWADYLQGQPYIDTSRMGVTGGSYGGYMTLWIIGHTHQFQAAVAQRVVSNFISMWGSSDMNWRFEVLVGDASPLDDVQTAWDHSPVKYLGNATTPTLIIHSEEDHRCPIEQGEQAFVTLKVKAGVDAEFVRFPGEPHGLSRMGRTDRRIARLGHIARWMDQYLKPEA